MNKEMFSKTSYGLIKTTLFMTLFLAFTSLYFFHVFYRHAVSHPMRAFPSNFRYYNETDKSLLVNTPGCRIPKLDPFDFSVRRFYVKMPKVYDCGPKKPVFHIKENGVVSIDEHVLYKQHKVFKNQTDCFFYPIIRKNSGRKPDDTYALGKKHAMIFDFPIEDDFILLKCKSGNRTFLTTALALTPLKPEVEERCSSAAQNFNIDKGNISVIIVGIDSISKLNFIRYFRNTLKILRSELSAIELNGYTKVADNTYPNLIPFLTGHKRNYYKPKEKRFGFYDDVEFVWKRYSEVGYRTLFSEDAPSMGTFVLNRRGFQNPPTDYYSRPYSVAVESLNLRHKSHCIGSVLETKVYFKYLRNFLSTMADKPVFTFTFMARLTHDILKYAAYADQPSYELINDLKLSGTLNRSLLIFFSDHGIRFGDIRQTYIGKIEERMPFMFLAFPQWFLKTYPTFTKNLEINRNRLTTPYDIHATLLHLLDIQQENFYTIHGQSVLTEISPERTCADANIAKHWCVCQYHKEVSTNDTNVRKAALAIVRKLNKFIKPYFKICAPLKLGKILDARISQPIGEFLETSGRDHLITLLTTPSGAIFEATVQVQNDQFEVFDEISRLNKYGKQSDCVQDAIVRKYCFCKNLVNS